MPRSLALAACLTLLSAATAGAEQVSDLYLAHAPVTERTTAAQAEAVERALRAVVVKVTGSRAAAQAEGLAPVFAAPDRYLQEYGYRSAGAPGEPAALWARFDRQALNRQLSAAGLPVWGRTRPATLVWLALDGGARRELVAADSHADVRRAMESAANARGIPIVFPLLDLADRQALSVGDVWGGFQDEVRNATQRYDTPSILIGRASLTGENGWRVRWTHLLAGGAAEQENVAPELSTALTEGTHWVADRLASQLAFVQGRTGAQEVMLSVVQVDTVEDYVRVSRYLQDVGPVTRVALMRVEPDRLHFRLQLNGGRAALVRALELGVRLAPEVDHATGEAEALQYRLLP
jgi:hypothetical protein